MNKEIQNLRKKADELMETAEELFKTAREMENTDESKKRKRPEYGEGYWLIDIGNEKLSTTWTGGSYDEARFNNFNAYLIEKECDEQIEKNNALNKIKTYILDNFGEWKPDWEDIDQEKRNVHYSHKIKRLYTIKTYFVRHFTLIPYLETEKQAQQIISDCESELITLLK